MSLTAEIDTSVLTLRLNELHHRLGIPLGRVMEKEARLLTQAMIRYTPPSGGTTRVNAFGDAVVSDQSDNLGALEKVGAAEQGRRAVAGDLRRIFEFASDAYMDFVDKLDKTPGPQVQVTYLSRSKTKKIVDWKHTGRTMGELRAFHHALRSKVTGRTPRLKIRDGNNIGVWKVERKMVVRESLFLAYLREVKSHVGHMKAGWTAAAQRFGAKMPAFTSGRFSGNGYALAALTGSKPSVTLNNSSTGIDRQMAHAAASAVRIRAEALARNIARMVKFGPGKQAHYGY